MSSLASRLTNLQVLCLVLGGAAATQAWVWLLGLWTVHDTPLLSTIQAIVASSSLASHLSLSLFALLSAVLVVAVLLVLFPKKFKRAALTFGIAFISALLLPALAGGNFADLFSFFSLWAFMLIFAVFALALPERGRGNQDA